MKLQFIDQLRSGCWTFPICMRLRFFGAAWGYSPWIHSENGDFTITLLNGFVQKGGYHQNCNFTWKNWMMPTLTDHQISGSKIGCTPIFRIFFDKPFWKIACWPVWPASCWFPELDDGQWSNIVNCLGPPVKLRVKTAVLWAMPPEGQPQTSQRWELQEVMKNIKHGNEKPWKTFIYRWFSH